MCNAVTFSMISFKRVDADIQNVKNNDCNHVFGMRRVNEHNETIYLSPQIDSLLSNYPGIQYIKNGAINSSNDLTDLGYILYDNYNEITTDGVYINETYLRRFANFLYYDNKGENKIDYNKLNISSLVNSYFFY